MMSDTIAVPTRPRSVTQTPIGILAEIYCIGYPIGKGEWRALDCTEELGCRTL